MHSGMSIVAGHCLHRQVANLIEIGEEEEALIAILRVMVVFIIRVILGSDMCSSTRPFPEARSHVFDVSKKGLTPEPFRWKIKANPFS